MSFINYFRRCCCCCCKNTNNNKEKRDKKKLLITGDDIQVHKNNLYEEISSKVPPTSPNKTAVVNGSSNGTRSKKKNFHTDNDKVIKRKNGIYENEVNKKENEDNLYEENVDPKNVSIDDKNDYGAKDNLYEIMPTTSLESSPLTQKHQRLIKKPSGSGSDTYEVPDYDDDSVDNNPTYENTKNSNNNNKNNINSKSNNNHYTNVTRHSFRSKFQKIKGHFDLAQPPSIRMRKNRASSPSETAASSTAVCLETNNVSVVDKLKRLKKKNDDDTNRLSRSLCSVDVKKFQALFEQN